jgi:hypothetical protein
MSGPDATATPFVGSDRRFEILDRLAARARATPPATTPQAMASRAAAPTQNQMNEPPGESDEDEDGEYLKTRDKDNKDSADRKGILDGRNPPKVDKDDKDEKDEPDKQAVSDKPGDKEVEDAKGAKDDKDAKDNKDKEASDKSQNKDVIDDKNDKDVKDVKDAKDKDSSSDKSEDKEGDKEGDKEDDKDDIDKGDDDKDDDKGDETGTGTFADDEFVDPDDRGQPGETSADSPSADGIGRPASLLTGLSVV